MIRGEDLPALNACLNSLSAILVALGYLAIRAKQPRVTQHKVLMLSAVGVSAAFLASYLYYHFVVKQGQPTKFPAESAPIAYYVYIAILLSHTILAVVVTPMVLISVYLGLRDRLKSHVRIARWTVPLWLYVSITGVVVYVMLYQLYPPS